jgi:hypothetical protein
MEHKPAIDTKGLRQRSEHTTKKVILFQFPQSVRVDSHVESHSTELMKSSTCLNQAAAGNLNMMIGLNRGRSPTPTHVVSDEGTPTHTFVTLANHKNG